MKYTKRRLNDSTGHGYARRDVAQPAPALLRALLAVPSCRQFRAAQTIGSAVLNRSELHRTALNAQSEGGLKQFRPSTNRAKPFERALNRSKRTGGVARRAGERRPQLLRGA